MSKNAKETRYLCSAELKVSLYNENLEPTTELVRGDEVVIFPKQVLEENYVKVLYNDLEYYVNLVVGIETTDSNGNKIIKYNGIRLVHEDELTGEGKLALIVKDISIPNVDNIIGITGIQGNIKTY